MNHDGKENGKTRLRSGVTSGSCAAAAARAAAELLFSGNAPHQVRLLTPSGRTLLLKTEVSEDSRFETVGNVPLKNMTGRVWFRTAPFEQIGLVR